MIEFFFYSFVQLRGICLVPCQLNAIRNSEGDWHLADNYVLFLIKAQRSTLSSTLPPQKKRFVVHVPEPGDRENWVTVPNARRQSPNDGEGKGEWEREPFLFLLSSAISNNVGLNGAKFKACLLLYMCLYVLPRHRRRCLHDVTCKFRLDAARLVDVSARFPERRARAPKPLHEGHRAERTEGTEGGKRSRSRNTNRALCIWEIESRSKQGGKEGG